MATRSVKEIPRDATIPVQAVVLSQSMLKDYKTETEISKHYIGVYMKIIHH